MMMILMMMVVMMMMMMPWRKMQMRMRMKMRMRMSMGLKINGERGEVGNGRWKVLYYDKIAAYHFLGASRGGRQMIPATKKKLKYHLINDLTLTIFCFISKKSMGK
jgi:hypothetical protein